MRSPLEFLAKRYIAGTTIKDAIEAAGALAASSISSEIDNLGENVKDEAGARAAVCEYVSLLEEIKKSGLDASVSLKITHMGQDISAGLAKENLKVVIEKARSLGNFVWFDMEGSAYTQKTLDIFLEIRSEYPNMGIAIQSYLKRSRADVALLIERQASVRLVKGAYKEPPAIAFSDKKDVDENFSRLMRELMLKGNNPGLATHDERLIEEAKGFATEMNIPKDRFEFQMLLGIKRELQKQLAADGYRVRVYVPYGAEWLPYTIRRLRERKENVFFVLKNLFD